MTSEYNDKYLHEFLILKWIEMDFIINRNQFFDSIFLEEDLEYKSHARYFNSLTKYNGLILPVFDFNTFLKDTFGSGVNNTFNIGLICSISLFSKINQSLYRNYILKEKIDITQKYLALKINVKAGIKRIPLSEIRLIPTGLREKMNQEGVLGCRFTIKKNIQYFVDIETIICKFLREKG